MEGNSRLPGVATEPRHRARAIEHQVLTDLDAAIAWAREACLLGESVETLLPAMLWAVDRAAVALEPIQELVGPVAPPPRGFGWAYRFVPVTLEDLGLVDELRATYTGEHAVGGVR